MDPVVSILIPCYNSESYIKDSILSALNQTFKEIEIIVVDDGSTDNSYLVAKSFEQKNVFVFKKEKGGASSARNFAYSIARGRYIQYLDADDLIGPEKIEKQLEILDFAGDQCIASGSFQTFFREIENSKPFQPDAGCKNYDNAINWLIEATWGRAMFPPVVWLTPRKLIDEAGPWNEDLSYNDDSEFFARVLLKSGGIAYCEDSVSYYRRGLSTSLGSRKDREARISELKSLNLVNTHLLSFENSLRVREACAFKYRKLIYSLYPEHRDLINLAEEKITELGIEGNFNFGSGVTEKLGRVLGWKNAKLIQKWYNQIKKLN